MGNIFFNNALKSVKINFDEIVNQKEEERECTYFLKKEERRCGQKFISKSQFNRYCLKCNGIINGKGHIDYQKYKKGKLHGKHKKSEVE